MSEWFASPASQWPASQWLFKVAYRYHPDTLPRHQVSVAWQYVAGAWPFMPLAPDGTAVIAVPALLRSQFVAVTVSDEAGHTMSFPVDPALAPAEHWGTAAGTFVGAIGADACGCLEIEGAVIWPLLNPVGLVPVG